MTVARKVLTGRDDEIGALMGRDGSMMIRRRRSTPNRARPTFDHLDASRWLHRYAEAQCCNASNDYKGGLEHFSELLQRFPNNVHILLEIAKARKFYESALRLEPCFLGAALALAELHVVEGRNKDAVSLLEKYPKDWADDSLHVKLAQVLAATNMLSEALSHHQAALRINLQNEAAKKGLERLEKQMKGMDPDAPEDHEENQVEDADGDQEDIDLL